QLVFVGRGDDQVKIRGYRIEPGEISAALNGLAGVDQAVVIAREDQPGDQRLVGYITGTAEPAELRTALADQLPAYMVPAAIETIETIPLTVNGKLDTAALPAPRYGRADTYRPPSTPTEETLAAVFTDLLGLDQVSVEDSFFDLGGNSLLAMQLVAAINSAMSTTITVRTIFDSPTIAGLSQRLDDTDDTPPIYPIETLKDGTGAPVFCLPPGTGIGWVYRTLGAYVDNPIIALHHVDDDEECSPTSVAELGRYYADRIQEVDPDGPYHLLGWSFGGLLAHEVAVELQQRGHQVASLIGLDAVLLDESQTHTVPRASEHAVLEVLLSFMGVDYGDDPRPLTHESIKNLVDDHDSPEAAMLSKPLVDIAIKSLDTAASLMRTHSPRTFDGPMTIFSAKQEARSTPLRTMWQPFVTGTVTEYPIDSTHVHLVTEHALASFGERISALIAPRLPESGHSA
nr:hypothetical protein [Actinomycetes bacterium]